MLPNITTIYDSLSPKDKEYLQYALGNDSSAHVEVEAYIISVNCQLDFEIIEQKGVWILYKKGK